MKIRNLFAVILIAYSLLLLWLEYQHGQTHVRPYFTDIQGSVFLYAINTSFTSFLLLSCALLFFISSGLVKISAQRWFCYSQIFVFAYLGLDDRFLIHELIGHLLQKNDAWPLLIVGGFEVLFILFLGQFFTMSRQLQLYLVIAAGLFAVMVYVDVRGDKLGFLRLSTEDLLKSWSVFFLFLFSYHYLQIYALASHKKSSSL